MNKKGKETLNKIIAMMLTFLMVFQFFPNIVIAIREINTEEMVEEITNVVDRTEKRENNIIGEDVSKRTLNEKHFVLEDGTILVAIYPENVHYEKDGKLEDIDNTLKLTNNVYENTANSFKATFEKTLRSDKLANISMDGFNIKWAFEGIEKNIVQQEQQEEEKQPIKNEEAVKDEERAETQVTGTIEKETKTKESANLNNRSKINLVEASIVKEQVSRNIEENSIEEKTSLKNRNSRIEYNNVIKNMDLKYDITSSGVKESIVLNKKDEVQDNFVFVFDVGTLKAELTTKKEIIVYNETKEDIKYIIETPYMFDSAFEYSDDIKVELEEVKSNEGSNKYKIKIIPNKEWLENENRIYPVTIDPTISTSRDYQYIQDTFIFDGDTTYPTRGGAHIIRIGNGKWLRTKWRCEWTRKSIKRTN